MESFINGSEILLSIKVKDNAGMWSAITRTTPITVDKTNPAITAIEHSDYTRYDNRITGIRITANDTESGITKILAAIVPDTTETSLNNAQWNTIDLDIGPSTENTIIENTTIYLNPDDHTETMTCGNSYYVAIKAVNRTGLQSYPAATGQITVDTTLPRLVFNETGDEVVYNETDDFHIPYTILEDISPTVDVRFTLITNTGYTHESTVEVIPGNENYFDFSYQRPGYGTYELYAEITDKAGNKVPETDSLFIRVNMPHVIDFITGTTDYYETNPAKPITLTVDIVDNDGDDTAPLTYSWDFDNDGTEDAHTQNPETAFVHTDITNTETDYSITLTVTDQNNLAVTGAVIVKVVNTTCGMLYADEYWSGTHQLTGEVIIPEGITLTTAPGTDVQITPNTAYGYDYGVLVAGTMNAGAGTTFGIPDTVLEKWKGIRAEGTTVFTGVTTRDAVRGLAIFPAATVIVDDCTFTENIAGIHLLTTNQLITNCSFIDNEIYGIKEEKGTGAAEVRNCYFEGNTIDYYHQTLTRLSMEELNDLPGCGDNTEGGE